MLNGLDRVLRNRELASDWGQFALVTHGTTVDEGGRSCAYALHEAFGGEGLKAVFGPQHGYWQCEPYNMFETPDGEIVFKDGKTLPLFSLYGALREPSERQLHGIDTLVLDLPDIGCRVYTYMTTLAACMRAASKKGIRVVVLDRPNPLGLSLPEGKPGASSRVSGNLMDLSLRSFVGWFRIPLVHGLSLGELGRLFAAQEGLSCDYRVVEVEGLGRSLSAAEIRAVAPRLASPNMPGPWTMPIFPVSVCLEGTNISEGRGTTAPFQAVGAPFLCERKLCHALEESFERLGIGTRPRFRPHRFRPRFDKFKDQDCGGVFFLEDSASGVSAFDASIALLCALCVTARDALQWREKGYEYNEVDNPLDLILGDRSWSGLLESLRDRGGSSVSIWSELRDRLAWARKEAVVFAGESTRFWIYS